MRQFLNMNNEIRDGGLERDVHMDENQLIKFAWPYSVSQPLENIIR